MKKIPLSDSSYFIGESLTIGENFEVGNNTVIRATNCVIGDNVRIGSDNKFLIGESLSIGSNSIIGNANDFTAITCEFGEYLFLDSHVLVGHGGKFSYDSRLSVGPYCMICAYTKINVNYSVKIGAGVGLGEYVDIWTHGSYPPVLEGFPAQLGPVVLGDNVWLPAKSTVLPNVTIGDHVVIGVNSVINKSLPSGCLAGGIPTKVLRENLYPSVDAERNRKLVYEIIEEYGRLSAFKGFEAKIEFDPQQMTIQFDEALFALENKELTGTINEKVEDFRDFLRRRGIKFYTGQPFKSILPPCYAKLLNYEA